MIDLKVARVERQTIDVTCYELQRVDGGDLPAFEPGAHIDVTTPLGLRQYSLSNVFGDGHGYQIGVKREDRGRGGSQWVHNNFHLGTQVVASFPRNSFRLDSTAQHHCLIAGGIGITPLLGMARHLSVNGASFEFLCFSRSASAQPFYRYLQQCSWASRVRMHFDDAEDGPASLVDVATRANSHVYLCGPQPFMDHMRDRLAHVPGKAFHTELFSASALPSPKSLGDSAFKVVLTNSRQTVTVPPEQSILQALREAGMNPVSSCESGICGACATPYLEGEPDHRDHCLMASERATLLTICCSRALGETLVLDM